MPDASIRFLPDDECRDLLGGATVGRVAVVVTGVPHVVPVNYVVLDGDVVFRSGSGTKLHAALLEQPVSVEVDRLDGAGLVTWAPGPKDGAVRVRADTISGRSVERTA